MPAKLYLIILIWKMGLVGGIRTFELLDETYRKAMAEKISSAYQNCPGNCGNEQTIERLRQLFPNFSMDEIPQKLKEAQQVDNELKKYLSQNNLDTPLPND